MWWNEEVDILKIIGGAKERLLDAAKLEPGVLAALRQAHRKLWYRRRAALEQDIGAVLPPVLHEDLPALPSVAGAMIEIPEHPPRFVLAR